MGVLMGGEAPLMPKNGYFKAEGLNTGWVGKIRNNRNFRIIGQGKTIYNLSFKISNLILGG
jgi:hypothetical protein